MRRRTARAVLHAIDRACERCPGKHKRQRDAEHRTELVYRNHGRDAHDTCLSSDFPCGKEMGSLVAVTGDIQLNRDATALPSPGRALALPSPARVRRRAGDRHWRPWRPPLSPPHPLPPPLILTAVEAP